MTLEQTYDRFQTTQWTEIRALAGGDERQRRDALELLIDRYWPPVYAHLRSRGTDREAAAELTQAFFVDVVLERGLFEKAEQNRGKVRSLLLTALKRFQIDQHRRGEARGAGRTISLAQLQIEDARLGGASAPGSEVSCATESMNGTDHAFDRRWAMGIFEEALGRAESHFRKTGRDAHWELFELRVLQPAITRNEAPPLLELAQAGGFASPSLGAAAVQVVKRRVASLMREVVAETVDDTADVDEELAEVRRYLTM